MPDDEQVRRADELRAAIERSKSAAGGGDDTEEADQMQPGESPKEYVERRARKVPRRKPPAS